MPLDESPKDGSGFLFDGRVTFLGVGEHFTSVFDDTLLAIHFLQQSSAHTGAGCVGSDNERFVYIWQSSHWRLGEFFLELIHCGFVFGKPFEFSFAHQFLFEVVEALSLGCKVLDQRSVLAGDTQKLVEVLLACWSGEFADFLHFSGGWAAHVVTHRETQKFDLRHCIDTLVFVDPKVGLLEDFENCLKVLDVFFEVSREDNDVIQIGSGKRQVGEDIIHQALKCLGRAVQAKCHTLELVQFAIEAKCRFLAIIRMDANLIVAFDEVHLREHFGTAQLFENFIDSWHRVRILFARVIQRAVVDGDSSGAVRLGHGHDVRAPGALAELDDILIPHFFDGFLGFGEMLHRDAARWAVDRFRSWFHVDAVHHTLTGVTETVAEELPLFE